jgi:hypothetical protein
MSWTKRLIINQALTEIGIASYDYDSTADQLSSALRQLDALMAQWINDGIVFDPVYPISTDPSVSDLDQDTNAPAEALLPMYVQLAIRIAPEYGKQVLPATVLTAKAAYSALLRNYVSSTQFSLGSFLKGAGNKDPLYPWKTGNTVEEEEVVVTP